MIESPLAVHWQRSDHHRALRHQLVAAAPLNMDSHDLHGRRHARYLAPVITHVYVDNFRCFEKFDFRPTQINLILGPNGAGKSSFLDLLHMLFRLIAGWSSIDELFPIESRARFSQHGSRSQSIRIDGTFFVKKEEIEYSYLLEVGHTKRGQAHIEHEEIIVDKSTVYAYDGRSVMLTSGVKTNRYSFDGRQSPLSTVAREEHPALSQCVNEFLNLWVIRPVPQMIASVSLADVPWLKPDLSNFADWLRGLVQSDPQLTGRINRSVRSVLDGFEGFTFEPYGSGAHRPRALLIRFRGKRIRTLAPPALTVDELSDGQRLLLALYTLLHHVVDGGCTLCIDEPENYLGLPEIQPWLDELQDLASKRRSQVFLVSHHPRVINLLASSYGHWFDRRGTGPVRVRRIDADASSQGVPLATLVERGWIYE